MMPCQVTFKGSQKGYHLFLNSKLFLIYLTKTAKTEHKKLGVWNICSLRLERSCSEMEKLEGEVSFPRENFHFPRSDSCLTECSEVRQSRSRKRKVLSRKRKSLRVFSSQSSTSFQPQGCIFSASNAS